MQKLFLTILYGLALIVPEVVSATEFRYFQLDSATVNEWSAGSWSLKVTHSDPLDMDGLASQWRGVWSWNSPDEMEADVFRTHPSAYLPSICTSSTSLCGLGGYSTTSPWTLYQTSGSSMLDDVTPIRAYLYFCDSNGAAVGGNCGSEADIRSSDLVYWTSVVWDYVAQEGDPELSPDGSNLGVFNPALGSTTSETNVYFSAEGYNANGVYDEVAFQVIGDSPGTVSALVSGEINAGYYSFEDWYDLPAGQYWGWVRMIDHSGAFSDISYPLKFRVATTNPDTIFGLGAQVFTPTATSAPLLPDCLWYSFDLSKCLYSLFIPSATQFTALVGQATTSLLLRFPFGYATRMYAILTAENATSSLPSVVLTVPDDMVGAGASIDLTPWSYLGTSSAIQTATDKDGNTLWDIIEVGWTSFCIMIFAFWALGVVLSEAKHH